MKLITAALLLSQLVPLPTPKPAATPGRSAQQFWHMECSGIPQTPPSRCLALLAASEGVELFTINDGDGPTKGGCDLGNLVRAARAHLTGKAEKHRENLETELAKCEV